MWFRGDYLSDLKDFPKMIQGDFPIQFQGNT